MIGKKVVSSFYLDLITKIKGEIPDFGQKPTYKCQYGAENVKQIE